MFKSKFYRLQLGLTYERKKKERKRQKEKGSGYSQAIANIGRT